MVSIDSIYRRYNARKSGKTAVETDNSSLTLALLMPTMTPDSESFAARGGESVCVCVREGGRVCVCVYVYVREGGIVCVLCVSVPCVWGNKSEKRRRR